MSIGLQHVPCKREPSGILSMESLYAPEHEELPFLLRISNFAASAVSAMSSGLPLFFSVPRYTAPPMRNTVMKIETCIFLFIVILRINFADGRVLDFLSGEVERNSEQNNS